MGSLREGVGVDQRGGHLEKGVGVTWGVTGERGRNRSRQQSVGVVIRVDLKQGCVGRLGWGWILIVARWMKKIYKNKSHLEEGSGCSSKQGVAGKEDGVH